jgi:hypothetical protein
MALGCWLECTTNDVECMQCRPTPAAHGKRTDANDGIDQLA